MAHFSKIGTGDILALVADIEQAAKTKEAKEAAEKKAEGALSTADEDKDGASPMAGS
jgi:signal recognition particle GTPase